MTARNDWNFSPYPPVEWRKEQRHVQRGGILAELRCSLFSFHPFKSERESQPEGEREDEEMVGWVSMQQQQRMIKQ